MSRFSRNLVVWAISILVIVFYAFFIWEGIPNKEWCYSPNKNFYLVKYFSLGDALLSSRDWTETGTVKIFTHAGELVASGFSEMDGDAGPHWVDETMPGATENSVYFVGASGRVFPLPGPPGKPDFMQLCY